MDRETIAFGAPLGGVILGMIVLLVGIFQGGLTTMALIGGVIGFASIVLLVSVAVNATP